MLIEPGHNRTFFVFLRSPARHCHKVRIATALTQFRSDLTAIDSAEPNIQKGYVRFPLEYSGDQLLDRRNWQ